MRKRIAGAAGLGVAVVAIALITAGAGAASRTCGPASARTLARNGVARIYTPERGGPLAPTRVYGCTFAHSRIVSLGGAAHESVDHAALGGPFAGYGLHQMGVDTGFTRVRVVDLRSGRVVDDTAATSPPNRPESFTDVTALVLNGRGHVAWIGSKSSIVARGTTYEVRKIDGSGKGVLDSSAQIDPASLRRHGKRISWTRAGVARMATLS